MPLPGLRTEPLEASHDRTAFTCGVDSLDEYFRVYARQDVRRMASSVFVLVDPQESARVLGYYTLSAISLSHGEVPIAARKHLPRYPLASATLVGRLAVLASRQGEGLGALLIADAMRRAYTSARYVGSSMLVVEALSERAAAFYVANGFVRLPESLRLVLPMAAIGKLITL